MPGGGFVTSYFDVTAYKRAQDELLEANENPGVARGRAHPRADCAQPRPGRSRLRRRARQRGQDPLPRRRLARLVQPLNAAAPVRFLAGTAGPAAVTAALIGQVENSLTAAENLISSLLDISRLDAGAQEAHIEHFDIARLLEPLAAEFSALARPRPGVARRASRAVALSDPRLLRRVLQNFLSNAVRYTRHGRILLGCRRINGALSIEVWDTGPGIPEDQQREIFEEFRRLEAQDAGGERGLGLGLAIASASRSASATASAALLARTRQRLRHHRAAGPAAQIAPPPRPEIRRSSDRVSGATVLCVDNEPAVLAEWRRCSATGAAVHRRARRESSPASRAPARSARAAADGLSPRRSVNGIELAEELRQLWGGDIPVLVITPTTRSKHGSRPAAASPCCPSRSSPLRCVP